MKPEEHEYWMELAEYQFTEAIERAERCGWLALLSAVWEV
jgi:hypothetical protein